MGLFFPPDPRVRYFGTDVLGPDSVAIGTNAGAAKAGQTTAANEVFIGYRAGSAMPSGLTFHTFISYTAGSNATAGAGSVAIGQKAFNASTELQSSVAVGSKAGANLPNAQEDTFLGYCAGGFCNATSAGRRVFLGAGAGDYENGDYTIMIGWKAGKQSTVNTTAAQFNIGIGAEALQAITGTSTVAIGYQAGKAVTTGSTNILIGHAAGAQMTTAGANVAIGNQAGTGLTNVACCIMFGVNAGSTIPASSQNIFVAGSNSSGGANRIDNEFFGQGYAAAAPTAYTINGTGGLGSNIGGADIRIAGGKGTGTGVGGSVVFQVAPSSGSSSMLNSLVDALTIRASDSRANFAGAIQFRPGTSVTPENNGDVVIEATNSTTLTFKLKGSDGILRTATLTLA